MEPLTWFGAYAGGFGGLLAIALTIAVICGLCAMLLSLTSSSTKGSFSLFNGIAVVVLLIVGFSYVYATVTGGAGGGMDSGSLLKILGLLLGFALFAAMLGYFMNTFFDDPAATMGYVFTLALKAIGLLIAAWLVWTLLFAGAGFRDYVAGLDPDAMPDADTLAAEKRTAIMQGRGIIASIFMRFMPVWISIAVLFTLSALYKRKLGLYGKLYDNIIGMIGFGLVMFWVFTAFYSGFFDMIATHGALDQASGMKNKLPGTPLRGAEAAEYPYYLLGGDNLARDVFSRMVMGSGIVIMIAPLATLFAFMVGITLGLPAGYFSGPALRSLKSYGAIATAVVFGLAALATLITSGFMNFLLFAVVLAIMLLLLFRTSLDTALSFLANLILAFPVILLFYLLVTPEIVETGLPQYMAVVLFAFPLIFVGVLLHSRLRTQPAKNKLWLTVWLVPMFLIYMSTINTADSKIDFWPLDFFDIPGGILVVFVSVVFVNSPTVFRIVRGLALDINSRDYVAAAQTRGEGPWYIMLWEILPNARGPLIVDFCLRIGYTTILLGTLGFFGLGLPPESPDWGSTINDGRKLLMIYAHPALPPAFALLSLVLGLNLLADGLREESLKD